MIKTGGEIEKDIYLMMATGIKEFITGSVYNSSGRPTDSKKEDAVISFLTGVDGQIQEGAVNINIYVPDIQNGTQEGRSIKDSSRCRQIESDILSLVESRTSTEYQITRQSIIQTFKEEEINQHFINCKIFFKRTTT